MAYGDKRDYRKIDVFVDGVYQFSTTWARTCREALEHAPESYRRDHKTKVTARFSETLKKRK